MGHEIHHDDFKVTTSKERILAMVSARAERDGDYHEPITSIEWQNRCFDSREDAEKYLNNLGGFYRQVAVQFNKHFNVKENLKRRYGNVIAEWDGSWTKGFCVQDGRVFNLVTKRNYFHKPTEETMRNALFDLREQAKEQRIKMLAMPKIGAGLDKMPWKVVLSIIIEVFNDEDITILVCDNSHERELREKVRDFAEESAEKTEPCKRSFDR